MNDHAISGASLIRPGIQALLLAAAQGKFGAQWPLIGE